MYRYLLVAVIVIVMPCVALSQYAFDYGMKLGASNYLGDIGGLDQAKQPFVLDMKMQETKWAIGGYARYRIRDPWSIEAQLNWVRISGADSLTSQYDPRKGRNLNFRNDIIQMSALGDWMFFENPDLGNSYRYQNAFSASLFAGISIFYQDPYAYNPTHAFGLPTWVNLHPLETEGVHYHLIQPGIPMGINFNFTLKKKIRIGWSLTWTKTFTDYLDDISGTYPAANTWQKLGFSPQMQAEAAYFSNRTTHSSAGAINTDNYAPGAQRGDPSDKDSFITTTFDIGWVVNRMSDLRMYYSGLFSKNRYRVKRRKAKF
jgi:hypothetical protein